MSFRFKAFIKAVTENNIDYVNILLKDQTLNPANNDSEALRIAAERGHTEMVKILLNDPRIDPSAKNNYAIKEATENDFTEIINLLYEDDRLKLTDLSPNQITKHINNLKTKLWSIARIELQSTNNLLRFVQKFANSETSQTDREIQLLVLDLLDRYNKLEKVDSEVIKDTIFRKYFLETDAKLAQLLTEYKIPKMIYFTRSQAALLITYLETNNSTVKVLLDSNILLSNKVIIKKYFAEYKEKQRKKYPYIHKITGPVSWSYYKYKGRNIHLFGDWHRKYGPCDPCDNKDCMDITQLIKYISKRSLAEKQYTNIFIEAPYALKETGESAKYQESYLADVLYDSYSCLQFDKSKCEYYPHSKYHYVDIRHANNKGEPRGFMAYLSAAARLSSQYIKSNYLNTLKYMSILEKVANELKLRPELIFNIYIDKNQGAIILDAISKRIGIVQAPDDLFKTGTKMHRIRYQLQQIDQELAKKIRDFFFKKYTKRVTKFLQLMEVNWPPAKDDIISKQNMEKAELVINEINSVFLDLEGMFMDVYFLSRMFRSMEWDQTGKLFIAYMGNNHKVNCDKFLKTLTDISTISEKGDPTADDSKMIAFSLALGYKPTQCLFNFDFRDIFGINLFR